MSTSRTLPLSRDRSLRAEYASKILRKKVTNDYNIRNALGRVGLGETGELPQPLPEKPESDHGHFGAPATGTVCIIGAGMCGLYLAMMCEQLAIPYDLLEASGDIGGRVKTYTGFGGPASNHNYVDLGAMRFPEVTAMSSTLKLIERLNVPTAPYVLNFQPTDKGAPDYFNQAYGTPSTKLSDLLDPFVIKLNSGNFLDEFQNIVNDLDVMSTREWLMTTQGISFSDVEVMEMTDTGTSLFSQAVVETILDYFDFNAAQNWLRIEGGTYQLAKAMAAGLTTKAKTSTVVTGLAMSNDGTVEVSIQGSDSQYYAAVFNTTTLGCLGRMELKGLPLIDQQVPDSLGQQQWTSIRALHYDESAKIAIKFQTAWWINQGGITPTGGTSNTDLPIRVVVYPSWMKSDSYPDGDDPNDPTVMIVSYTWSQDAIRMASLFGQPDAVLDIVYKNLVTLYNNPAITYDFLKGQHVDHYMYAWGTNPYTANAFALFGPGQFEYLYPSILQPVAGSNNKVIIAGEHASPHHAWIAGALDSAVTAMDMYLRDNSMFIKRTEFHTTWFWQNADSVVDDDIQYWVVQLGKDNPTDHRLSGRSARN